MRSWTLNQLRTFVAVARLGTMGAAAVQLGYTVGAISQQMHALQHEAGAALFIKDGRGLLLSDAGHLLLRHANGILAAEEGANQALGDLSDGINSTVRLGIFGSSALTCVSPALTRLAKQDPHIRVALQEIDPETAAAAVGSGLVDMALCLEYSDLPIVTAPLMSFGVVMVEPLLVVAHANASWADTAGADSAEGLVELGQQYGWLLPEERSLFGRAARRVVSSISENFANSHVVTDTALALALSAAGHGLTVATQSMLELHQSSTRVLHVASVERTMVLLVKNASLGRPGVRRVQEELLHAGRTLNVDGRSPDVPPEDVRGF